MRLASRFITPQVGRSAAGLCHNRAIVTFVRAEEGRGWAGKAGDDRERGILILPSLLLRRHAHAFPLPRLYGINVTRQEYPCLQLFTRVYTLHMLNWCTSCLVA